jgi:hypothetical protein
VALRELLDIARFNLLDWALVHNAVSDQALADEISEP